MGKKRELVFDEVREGKRPVELKSKNEQVIPNLTNSSLLFMKLRQQWPDSDPLESQTEGASLHLSIHIWPAQICYLKLNDYLSWWFMGAEINSARDNG